MKDRKIDKLIESGNKENKEAMRAELHRRLGLPQTEQRVEKSSPRKFFNAKTISVGTVGICAVTLAIVLPVTLRRATETPSQNRYCLTSDCLSSELGYTLKEYVETTGVNMLYIDWYDIAEECTTIKYFLNDNENDIVYFTESIINGETGDFVQLAVSDNSTSVDSLDLISDNCVQKFDYEGLTIEWVYRMDISSAYFNCNGYKYYIQLYNPIEETAILDIVKEMF